MSNEIKSRHVFLSYSHADADFMKRIRKELNSKGISVWTDEGLIPGTESWKREIENAIKGALGIVVILSPSSKQSLWVEREFDFAKIHGIRVFPVLVHGEPRDAIPIELINAQWLDLRQKTNFSTQIQNLVLALERKPSQVNDFVEYQQPRKSPVKPKASNSNVRIMIVLAIIVGIFVVSAAALAIIFGPGIPGFTSSTNTPYLSADTNTHPSAQEPSTATVPAETQLSPTHMQASADTPTLSQTTIAATKVIPTDTKIPPTFTRMPQWGFADCLYETLWGVYPNSARTSTDDKGCIIASNLGFYSQNQGLEINVQNPSSGQRYGLFAPISGDVVIEFDIQIDQLSTTIDDQLGSLSFGIISLNPVNADTDSLIYYVIESPNAGYPVFLKKGERGGFDQYLQIDGDYFRYPLGTNHRLSFVLEGNQLTININGKYVRGTNLTFGDRAFFIGYKFENAGKLDAKMSNLSLQER